jgi:hypothetical protein
MIATIKPQRKELTMSYARLIGGGQTISAGACLLLGTAALALPAFGDWSAPINAEQLPGGSPALNTPAVDGCVSLSHDGRTLVFNSNRGGDQDIYIASRTDTAHGFGAPQRLPDAINSQADEFCPTLAAGNRLYFSRASSSDPGDLYVSQGNKTKGWGAAQPLGPLVNTAALEEAAAFYEDDSRRPVMLFSRRLPDGSQGQILQRIGEGTVTLVGGGVNAGGSNNRVSVTHDGRTIFFDSTRPGGRGGPDLWSASRTSNLAAFGAAAPLTELNSSGFDARPTISWDGTELFFSSNRAGSESPAPDIWVSARSRPGR